MKKSRSATPSRLFSPRVTLAALGVKLRSLGLFEVIAGHVRIRQKAIKHAPVEKLQDAFIAILAGAHGLVEINTRVRADQALQRDFGRGACAEQSVVQETLSACTAKNVVEMQAAVAALFRAHSAAYRHDYEAEFQVGGQVELEGKNIVKRLVLNESSALALHCVKSLRALLKREHVRVSLGKT